jgi:hypothetical protein
VTVNKPFGVPFLTLTIEAAPVLKVAIFIVPKILVVPPVGEKVRPVADELNIPPELIVILVAGLAVVVAFKIPPEFIVTLDPAPEAVGLKIGVFNVPLIVMFKVRPVGIAEVEAVTKPPARIVTELVGAKVVQVSVPLIFKFPNGVEVVVTVKVFVAAIVVVDPAAGLNIFVVIAPFTFNVPAFAVVPETFNTGAPAPETVIVEPNADEIEAAVIVPKMVVVPGL